MRRPKFWNTGQSCWQMKALLPAALAYQFAHQVVYLSRRPKRADVPIICIGNVTIGGSGKTPVALDIASRLESRGIIIHFLSRGYGGKHGIKPIRVNPIHHTARYVGDEPLILAKHKTTWVTSDRVEGARAAIKDGADIIIMDDGFQNPSLTKDLSILVFDGEFGIGNGAVLPAGPLREPLIKALARAQAAVIIGKDCHNLSTILTSYIPVFRARFVHNCSEKNKHRPVIAFAGIGRPEKFFSSIKAAGHCVISEYAFPDHHYYTATQLADLRAEGRRKDAELITTEKDYFRLEINARVGITPFSVRLAWSDEAGFAKFLDQKLKVG